MIGIDFGTTNSVVARVVDGQVRIPTFSLLGQTERTYRSMVYLSHEERVSRMVPGVFTGPAAIEQYLEEGATGRLMQSLKTLLTSATFESTQCLGTVYTLDMLIGEILCGLREAAERQLGPLGHRAVVGRPVVFANASGPDDEARAEQRLRAAYARAGFGDIEFVLEPVAAAHAALGGVSRESLVLIADFGGGTSDFCVVRVAPGGVAQHEVLAHGGVGIAGDRFDARIVDAEVSYRLGRDTTYRVLGDHVSPIPAWLYVHLRNWYDLSFLREPKSYEVLVDVARHAVEADALAAFVEIVEQNLGFELYRAVEQCKRELSDADAAELSIDLGSLEFVAPLTRLTFEDLIADELRSIDDAMRGTLRDAGVSAADVHQVYMTGGTALTPSVRRLFVDRFGADALVGGGAELSSVATGLAMVAARG